MGATRVVVIDDDDGARTSLAFLLKIAGTSVVDYPSGDAFFRQCDLDAVNGLIVDQNMPGMTGLDIVDRLRAERCTFPIMLVTAQPSAALMERASELRIAQVLAKPFDKPAIMAFVRTL